MLRALLKKILRPSQLRLIILLQNQRKSFPAKLFLPFYLFTFLPLKAPFYLFTFLLFYLFNVRHEDVLIHLPIILSCRESECSHHQIPRIEFALSSITQHGCSILVFVLAAQLLQHDVALHHLAILTLLTLYRERLALLNNS